MDVDVLLAQNKRALRNIARGASPDAAEEDRRARRRQPLPVDARPPTPPPRRYAAAKTDGMAARMRAHKAAGAVAAPAVRLVPAPAPTASAASLYDMEDDDWFRVIDVTLNSVFRMTRAILPHMISAGQGAIVNNASVLGWRAQKGQSHYAAAKAGVMALTRCTALEVAEHGVRINAVSPSFATHPFLVKTTPADQLAALEAGEAYGRGAEPWEVANVMIFLASEYSSYMTGEVVAVSSQHP